MTMDPWRGNYYHCDPDTYSQAFWYHNYPYYFESYNSGVYSNGYSDSMVDYTSKVGKPASEVSIESPWAGYKDIYGSR